MTSLVNIFKYTLFFLLAAFTIFWVWLYISPVEFDESYFDNFSNSYGIIALISSFIGFKVYRKWGGTKSILGLSILFFSIGLLFQFLGQMSYSYYRIVNGVEVAYPSFGEIFYFGSIPLYIYASWKLIASLGGKKLIKTNRLQLLYLILISIVMLSFGYFLTLNNYEITDYGGLIKTIVGTILDYLYPITQAILVSLAIFSYFLARRANGGMLKTPIILTVIAMYAQYMADTIYTYRVIQGTYYGGDYTDMIYILSYFLLGLAFLKFNSVHSSLLNGGSK
jgi:hypothetical protein